MICMPYVNAQDHKLALADKSFRDLAYQDAINLYERLIFDGYSSQMLYQNLADAYYYQADYVSAKQWYDSLFVHNVDVTSNTYHKYVNTLKVSGLYELADQWMDKMAVKYPKDSRVKLYLKDKTYLKTVQNSIGVNEIKNAGINSIYADFSPSFLSDSVVYFSSARSTKYTNTVKHLWTNQSHTNIYSSKILNDSTMGSVSSLHSGINKFYNESSVVFTKDGKTMYFTRNNQLKFLAKTDTLNLVLLKIYKATFNGKKWVDVVELPFNSDQYSCAHPALSPDEKYLYFSSDMQGTFGKSDLYKVAILEQDVYGVPENLGPKINTEGRDTFPFITQDNVLIFASDARPGLGGLDLYYVHLDSQKKEVKTFSSPLNSAYDDFGLVYQENILNGFFASNRPNDNRGGDDIYRFTHLNIPGVFSLEVKITASDKITPIETEVQLLDSNKILIETFKTQHGSLLLPDLNKDKIYYVSVNVQGYEPEMVLISYEKYGNSSLDISLKMIEAVTMQIDLGKIINLNTIYFDFNKHFIRPDAALELEKIFKVMQDYPEIKIEIGSHTDSRSSSVYNQKLSQRRADATREWLITHGIAPKRLTAHGYGESKLLNECVDGLKCSKEQHQANRRSEFFIIN